MELGHPQASARNKRQRIVRTGSSYCLIRGLATEYRRSVRKFTMT